jgi:hypothetical protein
MQDYFIEKLKRVSFDRVLLLKEFQKSRRWLKKDELEVVEKWVNDHNNDQFDSDETFPDAEYRSQLKVR